MVNKSLVGARWKLLNVCKYDCKKVRLPLSGRCSTLSLLTSNPYISNYLQAFCDVQVIVKVFPVKKGCLNIVFTLDFVVSLLSLSKAAEKMITSVTDPANFCCPWPWTKWKSTALCKKIQEKSHLSIKSINANMQND